MDKRKKILGVIAGIAAVVICYVLYEHFMYVETDNAQVEAHSVMLAPKVSGFVVKVNVVEGQKVKAGDILVEIDERDYQNTLRQAKAELASLSAKKGDSEKNLRRITALYSKDAVSAQQHDSASTTFGEVNAKYESLSAQVAQAELNLENTKIKAPSDGFIAKKSANIGQLAAVGVPLIGFVDGNERWVTANFKETQLEGIKVGNAVNVYVDALGKTFKGTVVALSAATGATFTLLPPDNATGNFTKVVQRVPVRIKFEGITPEDVEGLRAGLSADVKVHKH